MMMARLPACALALLSVLAPAAEQTEQLDAEFLEYLAHLEGEDDDWTLLAQADEAPAPPGEDAESQRPKLPEQADRPAVDER
jgi:hypothetical protein